TVVGNVDPDEGGSVHFFNNDPVEDWYRLRPQAGVELNRLMLRPFNDQALDVFVLTYDGFSRQVANSARSSGSDIELLLYLDSERFGANSSYSGEIIVGISVPSGSPFTGYRMALSGTMANNSTVRISSVEGVGK